MGRYASYTAAFKLKAIEYALEHGNRAASRHFGFNEFCVRYWRRQQDELETTGKTRRAFRGPKTGKFLAFESSLLEYIKARRADGCVVSIDFINATAS